MPGNRKNHLIFLGDDDVGSRARPGVDRARANTIFSTVDYVFFMVFFLIFRDFTLVGSILRNTYTIQIN